MVHNPFCLKTQTRKGVERGKWVVSAYPEELDKQCVLGT